MIVNIGEDRDTIETILGVRQGLQSYQSISRTCVKRRARIHRVNCDRCRSWFNPRAIFVPVWIPPQSRRYFCSGRSKGARDRRKSKGWVKEWRAVMCNLFLPITVVIIVSNRQVIHNAGPAQVRYHDSWLALPFVGLEIIYLHISPLFFLSVSLLPPPRDPIDISGDRWDYISPTPERRKRNTDAFAHSIDRYQDNPLYFSNSFLESCRR